MFYYKKVTKALMVLLFVFIISILFCKAVSGNCHIKFSGNIAMCALLFFTASLHFKFTKGMIMMIPHFIPFKKILVLATGIAQIVVGTALLFPQYRYVAGITLIIFLVLVLPANIGATFRSVDFEKATYNGAGPEYLWFRIPLQIFLLTWTFFFSVNNF